jgi:hypothetical protein
MSWNNVGPIVELAPGASVGWSYTWNGGKDMGVQIAGPNYPENVIYPGDIGTLVASQQGKALEGAYQGGPGAMVSYVVTITNVSDEFGSHNLQGGGLS